jgi:transcriptional regulator with XRE-family HTH domain
MEVALVVKAKSGFLYRYMLERGWTAADLSRDCGLSQGTVGDMINFRWLPNPDTERGQKMIQRIEEYFRVPIEIIFPPELTREIATKLSKKHVEIKELDCVALEGTNQRYLICDTGADETMEVLTDRVTAQLAWLDPQQRDVIERLFGMGRKEQNLSEIAEDLGRSRTRIQQVAVRAVKRLRWKMNKLAKVDAASPSNVLASDV